MENISKVYLGVITMVLGTYYLPRLSSLVGVDAIVSEIHRTVSHCFADCCYFSVKYLSAT